MASFSGGGPTQSRRCLRSWHGERIGDTEKNSTEEMRKEIKSSSCVGPTGTRVDEASGRDGVGLQINDDHPLSILLLERIN
jgi:hypothetical protein